MRDGLNWPNMDFSSSSSSAGKESDCNAGDLSSIPGSGRCPGEGKGYPLQYSGLENSMDSIVHGVAKSRTWLSNFHFHFQCAVWLAVLVLQPKVSPEPLMWETWFDLWVGKIPWWRERQPTPVFWPGEFRGLYSPWGCKESDTTEWLSLFKIRKTF